LIEKIHPGYCYPRKKLKHLNICDMQIESTTELFDIGVMKLARYVISLVML
jgi:hypothetical protein